MPEMSSNVWCVLQKVEKWEREEDRVAEQTVQL